MAPNYVFRATQLPNAGALAQNVIFRIIGGQRTQHRAVARELSVAKLKSMNRFRSLGQRSRLATVRLVVCLVLTVVTIN